MSTLNATDWPIRRDMVGTYYEYNKFGDSPSMSLNTEMIVSDLGNSQTFAVAAAATSVVSSSANDAAAGTGARTVLIEGILGSANNYQMIREVITLAGVTPVVLTNQFYFVHRMKVLTTGAGGVTAGAVTCSIDGNDVAQLLAGNNGTLMAVYFAQGCDFVGNDVRVEIVDWYGSIKRAATTAADYIIYKTSAGSGTWAPIGKRSGQSSGTTADTWKLPRIIAPGDGIYVSSTPSANGAFSTAGFDLRFYI